MWTVRITRNNRGSFYSAEVLYDGELVIAWAGMAPRMTEKDILCWANSVRDVDVVLTLDDVQYV
jgi:hypothetical protein